MSPRTRKPKIVNESLIILRHYLSIDAKHIINSLKRQQNNCIWKLSIQHQHRDKHCGPRSDCFCSDCSYRSSLIWSTWNARTFARPKKLITVNPFYNDRVCSKLYLTLKLICCYKEIPTSTRFPHHNHLVKQNSIQMNLIKCHFSKCIHQLNFIMHQHSQSSLLSNVRDTCSCKRPCFDHGIDWHMVKTLLWRIYFE